jgi:hypothetical protein
MTIQNEYGNKRLDGYAARVPPERVRSLENADNWLICMVEVKPAIG